MHFDIKKRLKEIRALVGAVDKEQLRYVDSFVGRHLGLFMPVGGPCFYAITPLHRHPSYMFVLQFDDTTSLKIDGKVITGRHGALFALSPEILHHELPSETPPRYIAILIEREFFESQLEQYPLGPIVEFRGELFDANPQILKLLKRFMIEAGNKIPGADAVLHALSVEICHFLIRDIFNYRMEHNRVSPRMEIDRTIEYMHSHLGEKITVGDMSRIANMSPSHFSRIFRSEIGTAPMEYLNRIRMERVKKLLGAGDMSITEVALECGFTSSAYFSTSFFKKYRTRPSDFRNTLNKAGFLKNTAGNRKT